MKPKNIITIILLLFVAASIVYLLAGQKCCTTKTNSTYTAGVDINIPLPAEPKTTTAKTPDVIVYYLHNNTRCINCIRFEKYTKEVINEAFADQLKEGALALKILNYEEPENEHFVDDYKLVTKAVIVVKMQDSQQAEWKNLVKIWELVADQAAFKDYIRNEVAGYLGVK